MRIQTDAGGLIRAKTKEILVDTALTLHAYHTSFSKQMNPKRASLLACWKRSPRQMITINYLLCAVSGVCVSLCVCVRVM